MINKLTAPCLDEVVNIWWSIRPALRYLSYKTSDFSRVVSSSSPSNFLKDCSYESASNMASPSLCFLAMVSVLHNTIEKLSLQIWNLVIV